MYFLCGTKYLAHLQDTQTLTCLVFVKFDCYIPCFCAFPVSLFKNTDQLLSVQITGSHSLIDEQLLFLHTLMHWHHCKYLVYGPVCFCYCVYIQCNIVKPAFADSCLCTHRSLMEMSPLSLVCICQTTEFNVW